MTSSPAVTNFFPSASDHLSSVALSHQNKAYEWSPSQEAQNGREGTEDRTSPRDPVTPPARRSGSAIQRLSFSPSPLVMSSQGSSESIKSNPKSAAPIEPFVRDGANEDGLTSNFRRVQNRWSLHGSEKLVDPKIPNWDLSEELAKLKLANDDGDEDGSTTPPKNIVRDVVQIHETSPLDTSSSDTSLDSASPQNVDGANLSHSRESSTDTLGSEASARSQTLLSSLKTTTFTSDLTKDRPRSFSGALSDMDLRRLQNISTPSQLPESFQDRGSSPLTRDAAGVVDSKPLSSSPNGENSGGGQAQPMFPSLTAYPHIQQPPMPGLPMHHFQQAAAARPEDLPGDPAAQVRQFINASQTPSAGFPQIPGNNQMRPVQPDGMQYRQQLRGVNMYQPPMQLPAQAPPNLMPSPTNFAYPAVANAHGHHNHLSLGNSQQLYDMMIQPMDPAIGRAQQPFRGGHQHSASDPASVRDVTLLLGGGMHNMQGVQYPPTPGLYPPMALASPPVFQNQFFPGAAPQPQGVYSQEMIGAMGRTLPQYSTNGVPSTPNATQTVFASSPSPPNSSGPSANNRKLGLYKTELCRSWEEKGTCRYGPKCQFAHGEEEIRKVARHPKYKTEICRTFWVSGSCPYGKRCCFIHTELPTAGTPGAPGSTAEGASNPPPPAVDGRARSMSTNSDPNDAQTSLLARITAKRKEEAGGTTPTATSSVEGGSFQFGQKPPNGALRVDTNVVADAVTAAKQNKSAYPTFANNTIQALSPGPVTAGPDFGRHVGASGIAVTELGQRINNGNASSTNPRHSYNGSEASLNFGQQNRNVSGGSSPFGILSGQNDSPASSTTPSGHGHGHSRSGSASNWGSFSQKNHLASGTPYAHTPSPANEMSGNVNAMASPWAAPELNASTSRLNDRAWS